MGRDCIIQPHGKTELPAECCREALPVKFFSQSGILVFEKPGNARSEKKEGPVMNRSISIHAKKCCFQEKE